MAHPSDVEAVTWEGICQKWGEERRGQSPLVCTDGFEERKKIKGRPGKKEDEEADPGFPSGLALSFPLLQSGL